MNFANGTQVRADGSLLLNWTCTSFPFHCTRQASEGPRGRDGMPIAARSPSTALSSIAFLRLAAAASETPSVASIWK